MYIFKFLLFTLVASLVRSLPSKGPTQWRRCHTHSTRLHAINQYADAKIPVDISAVASQRKFAEAAVEVANAVDGPFADPSGGGGGVAPLLPNTDIVSLDGAENLGAILWTVVIFYGILTTNWQPNEWVLPFLARVLPGDQSRQQWYRDFEAGFQYATPPIVDLPRFALFSLAGYACNGLVVQSLGGDAFWGWSIAACLCFPALLINVSRPAKPSRDTVELEVSPRRPC